MRWEIMRKIKIAAKKTSSREKARQSVRPPVNKEEEKKLQAHTELDSIKAGKRGAISREMK